MRGTVELVWRRRVLSNGAKARQFAARIGGDYARTMLRDGKQAHIVTWPVAVVVPSRWSRLLQAVGL
jgi:hypothetical protein